MYISLASRQTNGFKNWAANRLPSSNDDDNPGGATPIALVKPPSDRAVREDAPHRPWVVPGVGGAF